MAEPPEILASIDIVNLALVKLGLQPIADWNEDNQRARTAKASYASIRNDLLASHGWKFARKHYVLTTATMPDGVWGYDNAFTKPPGVLTIWEVEGQGAHDGEEWIEEGDLILTNLSDLADDGTTVILNVIAIEKITNVQKYSSAFIEALAERLQAEWAEPLRKVTKLAEAKVEVAGMKHRTAMSQDGRLSTPRKVESCSFTRVR